MIKKTYGSKAKGEGNVNDNNVIPETPETIMRKTKSMRRSRMKMKEEENRKYEQGKK